MNDLRVHLKKLFKKTINLFGINIHHLLERVYCWSLIKAQNQQSMYDLAQSLRKIVPDISHQYSRGDFEFNNYWELKDRLLHAFQVKLMLKAIENFSLEKLTVVDIGDSAGTHMVYLKELGEKKYNIKTVSINLDRKAIDRIKARGLKALLKRAEDLRAKDINGDVDLFTCFEMVEHLHNPTLFFRRIARRITCKKMVITVPYLSRSRVGLHHIRHGSMKITTAENEHIFELSPKDWTLLILHSGWKIIFSDIYFQYPKGRLMSSLLKLLWKKVDFEGFWGAILQKETTYSDRYQDWEE